ncbi:MAG TPA: hypothetical protein VLF90_02165 [Patescibacteria group bacterium]|nr:hypothetical protein [Patescibacteria group bacterium]
MGKEQATDDDTFFEAIQASKTAEAARDRAYQWRASASNPISRVVSNALATHRDRVFYDSEEHVGLIAELRAFDEAHGHPPAS